MRAAAEHVAVAIPVLNEAEAIGFAVSGLPRDVVCEGIMVDGGGTHGISPVAAAQPGPASSPFPRLATGVPVPKERRLPMHPAPLSRSSTAMAQAAVI
jgi:hypothetical protein